MDICSFLSVCFFSLPTQNISLQPAFRRSWSPTSPIASQFGGLPVEITYLELTCLLQEGDDVSMSSSRLAAVRRLAASEQQFVTQMRTGVANYVIALRHSDVISRSDHDTLFINLETVHTLHLFANSLPTVNEL